MLIFEGHAYLRYLIIRHGSRSHSQNNEHCRSHNVRTFFTALINSLIKVDFLEKFSRVFLDISGRRPV